MRFLIGVLLALFLIAPVIAQLPGPVPEGAGGLVFAPGITQSAKDNTIPGLFIIRTSADVLTGLVAYYKFDNAGTRGLDSSLSGYNLTLAAGTVAYNTGKFGSGARFTTSTTRFRTNYASAPNLYFSTGSFSFAAWINVDATPSGNIQMIVNHLNYALRVNGDGKIRMTLLDGVTTVNRDSTIDYSDDTWHHVVMVVNRDDNLLELWSDGALHVSSNIAAVGSVLGTGTDFNIGNRGAGSTQADDGDYDEIMVYNRRLRAAEIKALYNNGTGFQPL